MRPGATRRGRRRLGLGRSLFVWAVLAAIAWLDASRSVHAQHAAIFTLIISGLSWLVQAVEAAGTAIAYSLEAVVVFLAHGLSWVGGRVVDLFRNTGAMFSKVWEGAKIVYSDVLKPLAQWIKSVYDKVKDWMVKVFGPILKWADRVRCELKSIYKRYVAPILKILDTTKAVLDILAKLHVPFAQAAETVVSDIEHVITENYLRILGTVNKVINTLNGFFTLDGLLQRLTFLRTLERDAFYAWRVMGNSTVRTLTDGEVATVVSATTVLSVPDATDDMLAYLNGDASKIGAVVDQFAASWGDYLEGNAGDLGEGVAV